ncbi:MAG: hypothetical protein JWR84_1810 [Caulobacter sp.]|nr:hypothetical protein [Caulobacter sp.]
MFFGIGFSVVLAVLLGIHAVRTGRDRYWLFILLAFPLLGSVVYAIVNILPDLMGHSTVRRMGADAVKTLNPEKDYREAQKLVEDAPTVANNLRLANAAFDLRRFDEAERLYAGAATGIHAEDATLLLGRAKALIELDRPAEALPILEQLGALGEAGRTPQAALTMGRAYHMLGRYAEADTAYEWAAGRLPGLEGMARYVAFLCENGRRAEAQDAMLEIDKRAKRTTAHFRREARFWRDYAYEALYPPAPKA